MLKGTEAETFGLSLNVQRAEIGGLLQFPLVGAWGIPKKMGRKICRIQRGWRASEGHVSLNNLSRIHMGSQNLKHQAHFQQAPVAYPLQLCGAVSLFLWDC